MTATHTPTLTPHGYTYIHPALNRYSHANLYPDQHTTLTPRQLSTSNQYTKSDEYVYAHTDIYTDFNAFTDRNIHPDSHFHAFAITYSRLASLFYGTPNGLLPSDDTYIDAGSPSNNYGTDNTFEVRPDNGADRQRPCQI